MVAFGLAVSATPDLLRPQSRSPHSFIIRPSAPCVHRRHPHSVRTPPRSALPAFVRKRILPAIVPTVVSSTTSTTSSVSPGFVFGNGGLLLRDRLIFYFGEFLMWNPAAKLLGLFLFTLFSMMLGSLLFRAADPQRAEAESPFWHSVRAIANPLEDDWISVPLRTVSIVLAPFGMVVFAILIGMVTDTVQTAVQRSDGGLTNVVSNGHIVVLGWNSRTSQTLRDFATSNERKRVVVLASADAKERLMKDIREVVGRKARNKLRILFREGVPILEEDLRRVSAHTASKIVLVSPRDGDTKDTDADRKVISRALALRQNVKEFEGDIVAELYSERDEEMLRRILSTTKARSVKTVNPERLLFRFMAQAIRIPGLAQVIADLMGSDTATIFHARPVSEVAPKLAGSRYSDLRATSINGCIIAGYFTDDDQAVLTSPGMNKGPILTPKTNLLLLGLPNAKKEGPLNPEIPRSLTQGMTDRAIMLSTTKKAKAEKFLICGWRPDMDSMLKELDKIVHRGSKLVILDDDAPEKVNLKLKNLSVSCVVKRPDVYENLEGVLSRQHFDSVVLLGSALGIENDVSAMGSDEDSKALATYVYVSDLLEKSKFSDRPTMVTIEFNNEDVAEIAREEAKATSVILPLNLGAKIAAQTMRDSKLHNVWSQLLETEGKEVYLVPAQQYLLPQDGNNNSNNNMKKSFGSMADDAARENDDTLLGYVIKGQVPNINPTGKDRTTSRTWLPGDLVIVMSEDKYH